MLEYSISSKGKGPHLQKTSEEELLQATRFINTAKLDV